jgi:hypothetical protein
MIARLMAGLADCFNASPPTSPSQERRVELLELPSGVVAFDEAFRDPITDMMPSDEIDEADLSFSTVTYTQFNMESSASSDLFISGLADVAEPS